MGIPQTTNKTEANNKLCNASIYSEKIIKNTRDDVLFTIDDGPTKNTLEIAQTLDSLEYEWIFFVVTKGIVENTRQDLIEAIKMGNKIGNHSYSHPNFQKLSIDQAKYQVLKSDSIITSLYQEAGVAQEKKYIRYPYGNETPMYYREEFNKFLDSLWYEPAMFRRMDTDLKDRKREPSNQKIEKIKENDTILLHEKPWTVQIIQKIVENLDNKPEKEVL